jgi:hypothetical protein
VTFSAIRLTRKLNFNTFIAEKLFGVDALMRLLLSAYSCCLEADREVSVRLLNSLNSSLTSVKVVVPYACPVQRLAAEGP